MASGHYRQSFRACTAPKGRPESPATVISANFGLAAAGPGNSEKCRPGAHCEGSARAYRHELRMRDVRMPSPIYRKLEILNYSTRIPGRRPHTPPAPEVRRWRDHDATSRVYADRV